MRVSKDEDNIDVNVILDQLNAFRIDAAVGENHKQDVSRFLDHCSSLISTDLGQLGVKCCTFITYLLTKSEAELTDATLNVVIDFLVRFVQDCEKWALPDILKALGAVLYGRGGRLSLQKLDELVTTETGILFKLIFDSTTDGLSRKGALQCVENICIRSTPYIEDYYASQCLSIFLSVLKTRFPKTDEFLHCKILITALQGISQTVTNTKSAHGSLLGELLAALKAYNFYGRDDPSVEIPSCLEPSLLASDVPSSMINPSPPQRPQKKTTKKKTKSKKSKGNQQGDSDDGGDDRNNSISMAVEINPWRGLSGSESDYSDTENTGVVNKLQSYQSKVRHHSLSALYTILKCTMRRIVFAYWTSFLPTSPDERAGTLAAVLHNETSSKIKIAALAAMAAFLERAKSALLVCTEQESSAPSPFTPVSVLLGKMIKEVHNTLLSLLVAESSFITITQTIKCLATVVSNSPYQKLKPGLLTRTVKLVRPYLSHRDPNIRVAALTCMGAVVTIHAPLLEVSHILLPPLRHDSGAEYDSVKSAGEENSSGSRVGSLPGTPPIMSTGLSKSFNSGMSGSQTNKAGSAKEEVLWLIKTCGRCVHSSTPGIIPQLPVRLEALQVLSSLVSGYLPIVRASLPHLTRILIQSLADADPSVQLHGAKTSESVASAMSRQLQQQSADSTSDMTSDLTSNADTFSLEEALVFWNELLSGPLLDALQSDTHTQLRATCCDCLSNIGAPVFQAIETNKQIMCITMLLGISTDPEALVREAAAKALGVYVLFPSQRADVNFVADTANAVISCLQDKNPNVRIKSAWAMANVTDALVLNMSSEEFESFSALFSDILLLKLFDVAADACYDNDKIKYNGVRALGNLLKYTQQKTLEKRNLSAIIENSVKLLVQNLSQGVMKVRWNACYALGSLLQNDHIAQPSATWLEQVHIGLCLVMKISKNFKVRINASQALQQATNRIKYGSAELFSNVWKYVIEAMTESTNTQDFTDYKYISSLTHQLCRLVLHLSTLIETPDLPYLGAVLFSKEDTVKQYLKSCTEQLDRSASQAHLQTMKSQTLNPEHMSVINTLTVMLTPEDDSEETVSESRFRPSYD